MSPEILKTWGGLAIMAITLAGAVGAWFDSRIEDKFNNANRASEQRMDAVMLHIRRSAVRTNQLCNTVAELNPRVCTEELTFPISEFDRKTKY